MSQPHWDEAPDWQKKSAINGVRFHRENPQAGDDASHNSWMQEKVEDGWVYGEVKDPGAKTHPCIVPYVRQHARCPVTGLPSSEPQIRRLFSR